jgi:hypothetical protein
MNLTATEQDRVLQWAQAAAAAGTLTGQDRDLIERLRHEDPAPDPRQELAAIKAMAEGFKRDSSETLERLGLVHLEGSR